MRNTATILYYMKQLKSKKRTSRGAALVEYALLVALIAVVCITAMQTIGENASQKLEKIADEIGTM